MTWRNARTTFLFDSVQTGIVPRFSRYSVKADRVKEWSTESMSFSISLYLFFPFLLCVRKAAHPSDRRGEYQCLWRCILISRANQKKSSLTIKFTEPSFSCIFIVTLICSSSFIQKTIFRKLLCTLTLF